MKREQESVQHSGSGLTTRPRNRVAERRESLISLSPSKLYLHFHPREDKLKAASASGTRSRHNISREYTQSIARQRTRATPALPSFRQTVRRRICMASSHGIGMAATCRMMLTEACAGFQLPAGGHETPISAAGQVLAATHVDELSGPVR
jgi:hypothetical protein